MPVVLEPIKLNQKAADSSIAIESRRHWKKFGESKNCAQGPDPKATLIGDAVYLKLYTNSKILDEPEEEETKIVASNSSITCRNCKGAHFTQKCPLKGTFEPVADLKIKEVSVGPEKYVAPARRGKTAEELGAIGEQKRDDSNTVRIANLTPNATENDVRDLLRSIAPVDRVFVARDMELGVGKGYSFVTFFDKQACEKAIAKLNGFGYGNLILSVDWSERKQV